MKKLIFAFLLIVLASCGAIETPPHNGKAYEILTSEDNNWTTSGHYYADSIDRVSLNEVVIYNDGRPVRVFSKLIKILQK